MLKKLNGILNIIMGSSIGVFIGHSIYAYWEYRKHPDIYMMQSAPWYTSIIVYSLITAIILTSTLLLKYMIKKKLKNS